MKNKLKLFINLNKKINKNKKIFSKNKIKIDVDKFAFMSGAERERFLFELVNENLLFQDDEMVL